MLRPADLPGLLEKIELTPQAVISQSVFDLARRFDSPIEKGTDDFDHYYGTAFLLDDHLPFALMHYEGHPKDTSTIYLPQKIKDLNEITKLIDLITSELQVTTSILWQRKDDPDL